MRYAANLSMLFGHLPLAERAAAARVAGFRFAETWWPFVDPAPGADELHRFCGTLEAADLRLVLLNLDAGDPGRGDRGLLSDPAQQARVEANLEAVACLLDRTGCRTVNALYGNRLPGHDAGEQDRTALRRLVRVADRMAELGACVVLETLNTTDSPAFPLTDIRRTAELVHRVNDTTGHGNVGLLLDTYHLTTMGTDPVAAVREFAGLIRHVQFADAPGRGRPGTGSIDFPAVTKALAAVGYDGFVGLEYHPRHGGTDPERNRDENRQLRT
ncbi:hydroxypyruvate isomerase [Prauserella shujinwangii]|uniref:Hydroxypyruvate isomerase n=1 Tax=Prauserella shujinwangii TaxID=1453103 RepID=A0A2T0LSH1_9PSEU|nr:TIM barrel protein [Prauserella shujinwangii]PRX46620.1 hydroxypyruvate isomerase [Prauserella shujinwangii]